MAAFSSSTPGRFKSWVSILRTSSHIRPACYAASCVRLRRSCHVVAHFAIRAYEPSGTCRVMTRPSAQVMKRICTQGGDGLFPAEISSLPSSNNTTSHSRSCALLLSSTHLTSRGPSESRHFYSPYPVLGYLQAGCYMQQKPALRALILTYREHVLLSRM